VLGDLQGWCPGLRQPLAGLTVQGSAHAAGQVLIDGITDQLMPEAQPQAVVFDHPGPDGLGQHDGQVDGGAAGDRGQVGEREPRSQDRGGPQRLQGGLGQEADPAQDGQPQRRRQHRLRHLRPPARGRDRPLLGKRAEQFGDEQRIARRPGHLSEQPRARLGSNRLRH